MNRVLTGPNSNHIHSWYFLTLLTAGHFFSDFYVNFLPILLPFAISQLGLSLTLSGILTMIFSVASNLLQPVCGYYIDRSGYTWLLLWTIPLTAIFICWAGLAPSVPILFAAVTLSGLASSVFHPLASSMTTKIIRPESKGLAVSIFVAGGNFGFALAPIILTIFFATFSLDAIMWLTVPGIVLTAFYLHSRLYRLPLAAKTRLAEDAPKLYQSPTLLKLTLVMSLRSWPQYALTTFLPILLSARGTELTTVGLMLTVFLLGGAIGGFIGGFLGDRYGYQRCILASLALSVIPCSIFLYLADTSLLAWIMIFLLGACMQSTVPASVVWAQKVMPQGAAMASGMMLGLSFGLGGVGAAITGVLADHIGLYEALVLTIIPLLISIPILYKIKQ
ncbi:MAG: MFS transporter [Selenomonadales bacterium]|nr:MFS transporter [Selenomonadales bacterium]